MEEKVESVNLNTLFQVCPESVTIVRGNNGPYTFQINNNQISQAAFKAFASSSYALQIETLSGVIEGLSEGTINFYVKDFDQLCGQQRIDIFVLPDEDDVPNFNAQLVDSAREEKMAHLYVDIIATSSAVKSIVRVQPIKVYSLVITEAKKYLRSISNYKILEDSNSEFIAELSEKGTTFKPIVQCVRDGSFNYFVSLGWCPPGSKITHFSKEESPIYQQTDGSSNNDNNQDQQQQRQNRLESQNFDHIDKIKQREISLVYGNYQRGAAGNGGEVSAEKNVGYQSTENADDNSQDNAWLLSSLRMKKPAAHQQDNSPQKKQQHQQQKEQQSPEKLQQSTKQIKEETEAEQYEEEYKVEERELFASDGTKNRSTGDRQDQNPTTRSAVLEREGVSSINNDIVQDGNNSSEEDDEQNAVDQTRRQTISKQNDFYTGFVYQSMTLQQQENLDKGIIGSEPGYSIKKVGDIKVQATQLKHFTMTQSGNFLIIADEKNMLRVHSMKNGYPQVAVFDQHRKSKRQEITLLKAYRDDKFVSAGQDKIVRVFNCATLSQEDQFEVKRKTILSLAFQFEKGWVAVGGLNHSHASFLGKTTDRRSIKLYNINKGYQFLSRVSVPRTKNLVTHLEFTNDHAQSYFYTVLGVITQMPESARGAQLYFIRFVTKKKPEIILNCDLLTIGFSNVSEFTFSRELNKFLCQYHSDLQEELKGAFYSINLAVKDENIDCDRIKIADNANLNSMLQIQGGKYFLCVINESSLLLYSTHEKLVKARSKKMQQKVRGFSTATNSSLAVVLLDGVQLEVYEAETKGLQKVV